MKYMEVPRPSGDGLCSDDDCPCGAMGVTIPRGQGYVYISKDVVDFRKDCPTAGEAEQKIERMSAQMGAFIMAGSGVFTPILMCEQGARKRGINLEVAAADARHWWETGLVPLRPTPMAGQPVRDVDASVPGEKKACFIATACYGSAGAEQVALLRRFRDRVLLPRPWGRCLVAAYYTLSPPLAAFLAAHPIPRRLVRRVLMDPLVCLLRKAGH